MICYFSFSLVSGAHLLYVLCTHPLYGARNNYICAQIHFYILNDGQLATMHTVTLKVAVQEYLILDVYSVLDSHFYIKPYIQLHSAGSLARLLSL